jgi:hypothetical protein
MSEAQLIAAQSVPLPPQGTTPRFIEFFTANIRKQEHAGGLCTDRFRFSQLVRRAAISSGRICLNWLACL